MKTTDDFVRLSFHLAGKWHLDQKLKSGVRAKLNNFHRDRVIYAFVASGICKYIGVCDEPSTTLVDRIGRYESMQGGSTNKRISGLIQKALSEGQIVEILAMRPAVDVEFAELKIDLVKGLENPLIQWADPEWNKKGKSVSGGIRCLSIDSLKPRSA